MTEWKRGEDMRKGDVFLYGDVQCVVTGDERTTCTDLFGREMSAFHARIRDSAARGWILYGPGGEFQVVT